jgi:phosphoribosylanthranilate isomerase
MTWVKICGMTNLEDALVAVDAGADAVGFVFYEKSPRCVSVETAREIVAKLPRAVEKVGVFVGVKAEEVTAVSNETGLTLAQIYSGASNDSSRLNDEFVKKLPCRVIAAVSTGLVEENAMTGFQVSIEVRDRIVAALVDSGNSQSPGGTGKRFNWENMAHFTSSMNRIGLKLVVAGGLTPENVNQAIGILHPWGVDVASGVEVRPGKKDPEKVRAFVKAVRETDRKAS